MSERAISDPTVAGWELNPDTGYWMWAAGGGGGYDDAEVRGLIADNANGVSQNASDIAALQAQPQVDAYTKTESDAKYVPKSGDTTITGTLTATDMVATG